MFELLHKHFKNQKVFLTGHTGFKGAWLLQMLHHLGAEVKGFALAPEKPKDLYHQIDGDNYCYASVIADINDLKNIQGEIVRYEPDYIFHLAAQPLVRRSYDMPVESFQTNAMGTAHVLEALRSLQKPCAGLMITTDKVYENPERGLPFKEEDKLGGYDPYAASKATAEIMIASYQRSFFHPDKYEEHQKSIVSLRAGNVIGGGDYADDRIVPDIVSALEKDEKVVLRNPSSVRPWQHVLEPLTAYLLMAANMKKAPKSFCGAYNIGPEKDDQMTVEDLTKLFLQYFDKKGQYEVMRNNENPHEANLLLLDNAKIKKALDWQPKLTARQAIEWTASWYADPTTAASEKCLKQIETYWRL